MKTLKVETILGPIIIRVSDEDAVMLSSLPCIDFAPKELWKKSVKAYQDSLKENAA